MKKYALSLIEVMVCLSLLSLLLSTLFFWYHSLSKQKEQYMRLKWPLMEERYAHQMLNTILVKAELPFFATENSIVFIFDHGTNTLPELSGKVLARLYYDTRKQRLCLGIWPKPTTQDAPKMPSKSVVLLDGITKCEFKFYHPPDPFKNPVNPEEVGRVRPKETWQGTWEATYQKVPAFIAIQFERDLSKGIKDHKVEFIFPLPVKIIYPNEKTI